VTNDLAWQLIKDSLDLGYPTTAKTHWDSNDPNELRCGLPVAHDLSVIKALTITDDGGTAHSMLLLRDPIGANTNLASSFTGTWTEIYFSGRTNIAAIKTEVETGTGETLDPTNSWQYGLFFIESTEMTTCL